MKWEQKVKVGDGLSSKVGKVGLHFEGVLSSIFPLLLYKGFVGRYYIPPNIFY